MAKEFFDTNNVKYTNYDVQADPEKGKEMVERSGQIQAVAQQLADIKELGFVGVMLGRCDILAITMVRNAEHLAKLVHKRISGIEGVRGLQSTLGVNFVKHDYRMARIVS